MPQPAISASQDSGHLTRIRSLPGSLDSGPGELPAREPAPGGSPEVPSAGGRRADGPRADGPRADGPRADGAVAGAGRPRAAAGSGIRRGSPRRRRDGREWLQVVAGTARPQLRAGMVIGAMASLFLAAVVAADGLHVPVLAGLGFLTGAAAAAWYAQRPALLAVTAAPPALFALAVLADQVMTAQGSTAMAAVESVLAGTFVDLSVAAPWLFAGMIAAVSLAMSRGLRECVRDFRSGLRAGPGQPAGRG